MCPHSQETPKNAAEIALDEARQLAEAGNYEEALEKHVWFHQHALRVCPSYYGVRLSFALSDWIELGKSYPRALETLKGIRDEKVARLRGGVADWELFHDVTAINGYLGEPIATVELFLELTCTQPDFAASVADAAHDAMVSTGAYELAGKYLGNPMHRFQVAKEMLEEDEEDLCQRDESMREALESTFTQAVVKIITVLHKTGDPDTSREIQSKALLVLDNPVIGNAITEIELSEGEDDVEAKVTAIFRGLVGDRALRLRSTLHHQDSAAAIAQALSAFPNGDTHVDEQTTRNIAFHLTDWGSDAAFLVALLLFPERFTPAEIAMGVETFLCHVPNHVSAAAVLSGQPPEDISGVSKTVSDRDHEL